MPGELASAWVERWATGVGAGSLVLDVACGEGRHARMFASSGCRVTAIDRDATLAKLFIGEPNIDFIAADLEQGRWPLGDAQFNAIVVTNYLHRPLFRYLKAALYSGGLLIYETFAEGNAEFGRPTNPDFLLRPRELLDEFGSMRILAFEDGFVAQPKPAMVQRIAVVNAAARSTLPASAADL